MSNPLRGAALVLLAVVSACGPMAPVEVPPSGGAEAGRPKAGHQPDAVRQLAPFLEEFRKPPPRVVAEEVEFPGVVGSIRGRVARPETTERLPAVLLVGDGAGLTDWMRTNAADLAGIGYVVLYVELSGNRAVAGDETFGGLSDERSLATLSAALRRLRSRADVFPDRIGVLGWSRGAAHALALAASSQVQACVVVEVPPTADAVLHAGLKHVPLLAVFAGGDPAAAGLPAFRKTVADRPAPHKIAVYDRVVDGFMNPAVKAYNEAEARSAWFEIYEFLGKYAEDAPFNPPIAAGTATASPAAGVGDLMRALHSVGGVWPALSAGLGTEPADAAAWRQVRSRAAMLSDAGGLLAALPPAKGTAADWTRAAQSYSAAARELATAADARDFAASKRELQRLAGACRSCHNAHR